MATPIPSNRVLFSLDQIAELTGGDVLTPGLSPRGIVIDSRRVREGSLFVAIKGERLDGHDYIDAAVDAGATALLVNRGARVPDDIATVEVDDTIHALGELARAYRARWGGPLVGITGSAGKTTTKALAAAALEGAGLSVCATPGNLNNLIGVPMTLFTLDVEHDVAVIEMGTNRRGEIARLAEIAAPTVGVVTLVGAAHTAGLGSIEKVAEEKTSLLRALPKTGIAIVNGDDGRLRGEWGGRTIRFGRSTGCDYRLHSVEVAVDGTEAVVDALGDRNTLKLSLLGEPAVVNALAALSIVDALQAPIAPAAHALTQVTPSEGRLVPREAPGHVLVLDDTYNANPRSVAAALDVGAQLAAVRGGRLVAILGDMLELGSLSRRAHADVLRRARGRASVVISVGGEMKRAAKSTGIGRWVADAQAVNALIARVLKASDVVLVKGSRSMRLERVSNALVSGELFR